MSARQLSAWWVDPRHAVVVPVQAHVLTLLEEPRRFGLTLADLRRAGADAGPINHLDNDPRSPRMRLIATAVAKGWVRVRSVAGRYALIQVAGGDTATAARSWELLVQQGARLSQRLRIIDPEHGIDLQTSMPRCLPGPGSPPGATYDGHPRS
jgi:hypothetical protein